MHCQGQNTDNGGTHWTFTSVPMMEIVDKVAPSYTIELPKGNQKMNHQDDGFRR